MTKDNTSLRASPVVLSMQPRKNIFHIQVSLFTLCNPTHKTERKQQIGSELLIAKGPESTSPMTAPVGRSVHQMGWMIHLFFFHLFTLR
jgi:hypothetical protein